MISISFSPLFSGKCRKETKTRNGSSSTSDAAKREAALERNRQAAKKCRTNKKNHILALQQGFNNLQEENARLRAQAKDNQMQNIQYQLELSQAQKKVIARNGVLAIFSNCFKKAGQISLFQEALKSGDVTPPLSPTLKPIIDAAPSTLNHTDALSGRADSAKTYLDWIDPDFQCADTFHMSNR